MTARSQRETAEADRQNQGGLRFRRVERRELVDPDPHAIGAVIGVGGRGGAHESEAVGDGDEQSHRAGRRDEGLEVTPASFRFRKKFLTAAARKAAK